MSQGSIAVVIPAFRAPERLARCLAHVKAQTRRPLDVHVHDNSLDNRYYTAAVNEGLKRHAFREDVEHVLVLSQDAYLAPDCVARLAAFMAERPDCGIACPVQVDATGAVTWSGSLDAFPSGIHRTQPARELAAAEETYWANGACMMIRALLIREIGLLDRNLRFVCSDADYSFTARARGWTIFLVRDARCEHTPGQARQPEDPALRRVMVEDFAYFYDKWLSGGLYRRLAHEGARLTPQTLADFERELAAARARLESGR